MNLADMLGYADIKQLLQIADAYRCECDGHSKHELMQSILQAALRKEWFDEQIGKMPLEDLRFLQSILFDDQNAFSLEELIARVRQSRFESVETRSGGFKPADFAGESGGFAKESEAGPATAGGAEERTTDVLAALSADRSADSGRTGRKGKIDKTEAKGGRSRSKSGRASVEPPAPPTPRDAIMRFKHSGWLFNGLSGTGRYLFQVPDDLKRRFRDALHRKLESEIVRAGEPRFYRDEQALIEADLAKLLRFAATEEIPLTQEGVLYRRQVQQLLELFAVGEEMPPHTAWRFGYGRRFREYPDRLALLYDYAYFKRWLSEEGHRLTLTEAGLEQLQSGMGGEPDGLFRFWLRLYRRAIPNLPALIHWIRLLSPGWVTAASLEKVLVPFVKPFYFDAPETVLRLRVFAMLTRFGMLSAGEHEEHGSVLRMTQRGRELSQAVTAGLRD